MWKLKLDDKGNVVLQDGKPVFVKPDGTEVAIDINQTNTTIANLNAEARSHREAKEAAETKLKAFENIDPAKARDALDKISKIDQKQLIDAGKVDEVRNEITKAFEKTLTEVSKKNEDLSNRLQKMVRSNAFDRSKFIADKLAIPVDIAESFFGQNFTVTEDGRLEAKYPNGSPIYAPSRPGELANFDEALEVLVGQYPNKDSIMKGRNQSGGGSPGSGGADGNKMRYTRAEFDAKNPAEKMQISKDMAAGKVIIAD